MSHPFCRISHFGDYFQVMWYDQTSRYSLWSKNREQKKNKYNLFQTLLLFLLVDTSPGLFLVCVCVCSIPQEDNKPIAANENQILNFIEWYSLAEENRYELRAMSKYCIYMCVALIDLLVIGVAICSTKMVVLRLFSRSLPHRDG